MPVYPVLRSAMTTNLHSSEVGKETNIVPIVNTHQVQSSQNPTVAPRTTREQLIKTEILNISKKTCVSVPPLQMARPDPISTWEWQCPPGFLAQILLPLCQHISRTQCPSCTLCSLSLNSNNATWKNGNLTSPADFPGARHCVGSTSDWLVSTLSEARIMIHSHFTGIMQVRERPHVKRQEPRLWFDPSHLSPPTQVSPEHRECPTACHLWYSLPHYNRSSSMIQSLMHHTLLSL